MKYIARRIFKMLGLACRLWVSTDGQSLAPSKGLLFVVKATLSDDFVNHEAAATTFYKDTVTPVVDEVRTATAAYQAVHDKVEAAREAAATAQQDALAAADAAEAAKLALESMDN